MLYEKSYDFFFVNSGRNFLNISPFLVENLQYIIYILQNFDADEEIDVPDLYYKEEGNSEPFPTLPEKRKRAESPNLESDDIKIKQRKKDIIDITFDESDDGVS